MKRLTTIILLVFTMATMLLAQAPHSFNYQAVVRDASGQVIANQLVGLEIGILETSSTGSAVYTETFSVTTNQFGLVNVAIGTGTTTDDFSSIDWGVGMYFLKISIDETGGTNYMELGTSQLISVPYSLFAESVRNTDDADADPSNEMQVLNYSNDTLYLSDGGQVYLGDYSSLWSIHGDDIYNSNPKNVGVGIENPMGKLVVQGDSAVSDTFPLFEVKNKNGQTIFAVYDGGVRIYVQDDDAMYDNNDKSGFAIGGYRLDKNITNEYMRVTPDSVRIYIKDDDAMYANNDKGGFAIGGYRLDKSVSEDYFNVYTSDTVYLQDTTSRMLWYPLKEAFMVGKIVVTDPTDIGTNSWSSGYFSKSKGDYSQAMGYRAQAFGEKSISIGDSTFASGNTAIAMGYGAKAIGDYSCAIGSMTITPESDVYPDIKTVALGSCSFAIGMADTASGRGAFAIGNGCIASGEYSFALGNLTQASDNYATAFGHETKATGWASTALGSRTNANGINSTVMGYYTEANFDYETVIGKYNTLSYPGIGADYLFVVGNGASDIERSDAFIVRQDGEVLMPDVYSDAVGTTNRDLYIDNTGKIGYLSSSIIYKKQVKAMENVDWLYKLRPVNYLYKTDKKQIKQYGLIAEEVEKVNPLFVSYNEKGKVETVNYSTLVTPMLKAIQDLKKEIEQLKKELEAVKQEK